MWLLFPDPSTFPHYYQAKKFFLALFALHREYAKPRYLFVIEKKGTYSLQSIHGEQTLSLSQHMMTFPMIVKQSSYHHIPIFRYANISNTNSRYKIPLTAIHIYISHSLKHLILNHISKLYFLMSKSSHHF